MFDDLRRVMAGVLVVVGLLPSELEDALHSARLLGSWFWDCRTRYLHILAYLQEAKLKGTLTDWVLGGEFCVSLVEVSGLTGDQLSVCESGGASGLPLLEGIAHAGWVGSSSLPTNFVDGSEVRLRDVQGSLSHQLIAMMVSTFGQFHRTIMHCSKRRRVLRSWATPVSALIRGHLLLRSSVSVDAFGDSPSSSSACFPLLPQTPYWLLSGAAVDFQSVFPLRPGLGSPSQGDFVAIASVLESLLSKAWETTRLSPGARLLVGRLKQYESGEQVSNILISCSDRSSMESGAKYRLVWIASMAYLRSRLEMARSQQMQSFDVESCGVWAFIVGEGRDYVTVLPSIRDLLKSDIVELGRVVLLPGPDLRRYVQIYESLCASERRSRVLGAGDGVIVPCGVPLFRVWLGLDVLETGFNSAIALLGPAISRAAMLDCAELALGVVFSEFQRSCILDIDCPVTHWSFVAGAGKTQMLLALVYISAKQCSSVLTVLSVFNEAVARDLESALGSILRPENVLRLEVQAGSDGTVDVCQEWWERRLQQEMVVDVCFLDALDRCLFFLVSPCFGVCSSYARSCLCILVTWLLAIRHDYLDAFVYSQVRSLRNVILQAVNVLVVPASVLNKLHGGTSHWSSWFHSRARGLLLVDELPGQSFEEVAAGIVGFGAAVLAGDGNQFLREQRQSHVSTINGVASCRYVCPLDSDRSSDWVEALARQSVRVASISSSTQYRYAGDTIDFIQYVFPGRVPDLECPLESMQTFVVPHVFKLDDTSESWVFRSRESDSGDGSAEILRHRLLFAQVLAVVAVEMVLAHARGFRAGKCQLLIMWCLKTPLELLVAYLKESIVEACWYVHQQWGLAEPCNGYCLSYDLSLWISTRRFQYSTGQNGYGSASDVVLWFLVRRFDSDWGLRGEQTFAPFVFEQCSRATLRQHLFLEDLRAEEWLPCVEPYWSEGWKLGIQQHWQYSGRVPRSCASFTLTVLRIIEYATVVLVDRHSANVIVSGEQRALSFLLRSPMCRQQLAAESTTGLLFASLPDVARREDALLSACLCRYDSMQWRHDVLYAAQTERVYCVQKQLHLSGCAGSVSLRLFDEWLGFLSVARVELDAAVLSGHDHLCDIFPDDVAAGDVGDFDFHLWTRIVLPTMSVHILGMDRRDGDGGYETFEYAMHYVNVCVPFSSSLSDDVCYPHELIVRLASLVYHEYLETVRGQELLSLGSFKFNVDYRKSKECEDGIYRFLVGPCVSDRQAATLVFYPHANAKFRKPVEMLHWYVASGFAKQHTLQEIMLARVRDIGLAQTLVCVVQRVLCVGHVSVRYLTENAADTALLRRLWCEQNSSVLPEPLPQVTSYVVAAAEFVGAATSFADCIPFLEALLSASPKLLGLLSVVMGAHVSEAMDSMGDRLHEVAGGVEPEVVYMHEIPNCRVPPVELRFPGVFAATLFWGGLSPVLNVKWLRWRRVTHVLNCMCSVDPLFGNTEPNYVLAVGSRSSDIDYIDWSITDDASRKNYLVVFSRLERILKHAGSCLYVHCKSGRDSSAVTLYALLQLQFGLSSHDAWAALQVRVGRNRWPVATVWDNHEILCWIDDVLQKRVMEFF